MQWIAADDTLVHVFIGELLVKTYLWVFWAFAPSVSALAPLAL